MKMLITLVVLVVLVACTGTDKSVGSNDISRTSTTDSMIPLRHNGDSVRNRPPFVDAAMARLREQDAKRTPLSFAFVNTRLPNGVVAILRVNQPGAMSAYAIFDQTTFDSRAYVRSLATRAWYDHQRGDDLSPATITLFDDGRMEAVSRDGGRFSGQLQSFGPASQIDNSGVAGRVLKKLNKSRETFDAPGFGTARIVSPK